MNWGLELSPKTDGFMALARSSPSVDFVCQRVRKERKEESDGQKGIGGDRETERDRKEESKIKVLHSNL